MGKCIYCQCDIVDNRAVDVCDKCGISVWGKKMFQAIKDNMGNAREKGDLHQGLVTIGNREEEIEKGQNNQISKV